MPQRERHDSDNYETPPAVVRSVVPFLPDNLGSVLDPAAGRGVFEGMLGRLSRSWLNMDIRDTGIHGLLVHDFLTGEIAAGMADTIITNPPFSLGAEFIERAHLWAPQRVIFLMRLSMLGSLKRLPLWKRYPLRALYTIVPRPSFTGGGSDNSEYAWFCWGDLPGPAFGHATWR